MLAGALTPSSYDLVRGTWRAGANGDFETWWRQVLHDGRRAQFTEPARRCDAERNPIPSRRPLSKGRRCCVAPDPSLWDGCYANNAWLQECPKPLTKQVWGNVLSISAGGCEATRPRQTATSSN